MPRPIRWLTQALLYGAFALAVGVLSHWPPFRQLGANESLLRLSMLHAGVPLHDCRARSPEELARIAPHMRTALDCPRERSPVRVRVALDDRVLLDESFPASGLARDGAAAAYRRLAIPAGPHRLRVAFNDDARHPDALSTAERDVQLAPGQVVLIDFDPRRGGVVIQ